MCLDLRGLSCIVPFVGNVVLGAARSPSRQPCSPPSPSAAAAATRTRPARPAGDGRIRQHHPRRDPALAQRDDGDQRGLGARRRAARDRGDQRRRRRAGQAAQAGHRGRRIGLADLRREGAEAHLDRQGRRHVRRLDVGEPQGDAARLRAQQGAAVLPRPVRGPGGVAVHLLHRRHDEPADHPRPRVPQGEAEGQGRSSSSARTTCSRARRTRRSRPGRRPTA